MKHFLPSLWLVLLATTATAIVTASAMVDEQNDDGRHPLEDHTFDHPDEDGSGAKDHHQHSSFCNRHGENSTLPADETTENKEGTVMKTCRNSGNGNSNSKAGDTTGPRTTRSSSDYSQELKTWLVDSMGGYWNDKVDIQSLSFPLAASSVANGDNDDDNDDDDDANSSPPFSSSFGVFAMEDLEPGELVFQFPKDAFFRLDPKEIISPEQYLEIVENNDDNKHGLDDEELEKVNLESHQHLQNICRLAKHLLGEIRQYRRDLDSVATPLPSSKYAPYIGYLEETQSRRRGQIPATYSPEGKQLLRTIQGVHNSIRDDNGSEINDNDFLSPVYGKSPLPPAELVDWIDTHCLSDPACAEIAQEEEDPEEFYHTIALTFQRSFDLELIPIWDMVNHGVKGRWNVQASSLRWGEGLKIWTTRSISKGEEILYTYNYCTDCWDEGKHLGTPGMYRDHGFVEDYPQEWPFLDHDVYATIHRRYQSHNNGTDNEATSRSTTTTPTNVTATTTLSSFSQCDQDPPSYYATFASDSQQVYAPDVDAISFFQQHLSRLKAFDIASELKVLSSSYEQTMIQQFYDSLVIALDSIIQAGLEHLQE